METYFTGTQIVNVVAISLGINLFTNFLLHKWNIVDYLFLNIPRFCYFCATFWYSSAVVLLISYLAGVGIIMTGFLIPITFSLTWYAILYGNNDN